MSAKNLFNQ
jgi:hypothetical protein